jgi:hypothetical protein
MTSSAAPAVLTVRVACSSSSSNVSSNPKPLFLVYENKLVSVPTSALVPVPLQFGGFFHDTPSHKLFFSEHYPEMSNPEPAQNIVYNNKDGVGFPLTLQRVSLLIKKTVVWGKPFLSRKTSVVYFF